MLRHCPKKTMTMGIPISHIEHFFMRADLYFYCLNSQLYPFYYYLSNNKRYYRFFFHRNYFSFSRCINKCTLCMSLLQKIANLKINFMIIHHFYWRQMFRQKHTTEKNSFFKYMKCFVFSKNTLIIILGNCSM